MTDIHYRLCRGASQRKSRRKAGLRPGIITKMKKGVNTVLSILAGTALGAGTIGKAVWEKVEKANKMSEKHLALFLMMNQWVKVKQEGVNLSEYFEKNGYKRIAVYGMSYAGETLMDELKGTDVEVVYGIDRKADSLYADVEIKSMDDELGEVDAVVVTAITFFSAIEEELGRKLNCPIISLEDILYDT